MKYVTPLFTLALMSGMTVFAHAEGQPQQGRAIAQGICAECHAVQQDGRRSPNPDAPPFAMIARTPGMTQMALSAALQTSHRTMPNIVLKSDEMADVIAYILGLQGSN
jgi:mono/diheme cytochrome c family protein